MNEKQVLAFDVTIKAVNEEDNSVIAVFSHKSRDRAGDVLPPEVLMAGAENFLKNPVLLDSHDYKGVENIIGKVEDLKVSGGGLTGRAVYFTGKGNEAAAWASARWITITSKKKTPTGMKSLRDISLKKWNCWK